MQRLFPLAAIVLAASIGLQPTVSFAAPKKKETGTKKAADHPQVKKAVQAYKEATGKAEQAKTDKEAAERELANLLQEARRNREASGGGGGDDAAALRPAMEKVRQTREAFEHLEERVKSKLRSDATYRAAQREYDQLDKDLGRAKAAPKPDTDEIAQLTTDRLEKERELGSLVDAAVDADEKAAAAKKAYDDAVDQLQKQRVEMAKSGNDSDDDPYRKRIADANKKVSEARKEYSKARANAARIRSAGGQLYANVQREIEEKKKAEAEKKRRANKKKNNNNNNKKK